MEEKVSVLLRRAAEELDGVEYEGCCWALLKATYILCYEYTTRERAIQYFQSLFKSHGNHKFKSAYWMGPLYRLEHNQHRVIALLLTADMAESVGD